MFPRYWASIAKGWLTRISIGVRDITLTILWKNHCITLINLPWRYHESISIHFCFPIFWWLIFFKSENFDAVAIHQFWSKWTETKPQWLILVNITTNFAPKTHFLELRCPNMYWPEVDFKISEIAKFGPLLAQKRQNWGKFFYLQTPKKGVYWSFLALILGTPSQALKILTVLGCLERVYQV